MLITALKEYGITELPGAENHPRILEYMSEAGFDFINEETSWCSIFINWCAMKAGLERSGKATARSWLNVGSEVEEPELGDVVIFWRSYSDSWKGHVGLFISRVDDSIYCLGGNQSNQVNISVYTADRLLGYRRLNSL